MHGLCEQNLPAPRGLVRLGRVGGRRRGALGASCGASCRALAQAGPESTGSARGGMGVPCRETQQHSWAFGALGSSLNPSSTNSAPPSLLLRPLQSSSSPPRHPPPLRH